MALKGEAKRQWRIGYRAKQREMTKSWTDRNPERVKAYRRAYHAAHYVPKMRIRMPAAVLEERHRAQRRRSNHAMRAIIQKIKMERGCQRCGFNAHPAALHFHHRDPRHKEFKVAVGNYSMAKRITEIEKCDVLCANCHAIETAEHWHHYNSKQVVRSQHHSQITLF